MIDPMRNVGSPAKPLSETLHTLAAQLPTVQRAIEEDHAQRCLQFQEITRLAEGTGFEAIAKSLMPASIVIAEAVIDLRFTFSRTIERELSIRLVNLSYSTRFQHTESPQQTIRFMVKRTPFEPGQYIKLNSPTEENNHE